MNLDIKPEDATEEMLIGVGQDIVRYSKKASILLGELAIAQENLKSHSHLKEFAKEIGVSYKSLSSYKSIEKRLDGLDVPEDINYSARRLIAEAENPKETIEHIVKEGLSSAEIIFLYGNKETKHKEVECPKCHEKIQL